MFLATIGYLSISTAVLLQCPASWLCRGEQEPPCGVLSQLIGQFLLGDQVAAESTSMHEIG